METETGEIYLRTSCNFVIVSFGTGRRWFLLFIPAVGFQNFPFSIEAFNRLKTSKQRQSRSRSCFPSVQVKQIAYVDTFTRNSDYTKTLPFDIFGRSFAVSFFHYWKYLSVFLGTFLTAHRIHHLRHLRPANQPQMIISGKMVLPSGLLRQW